MSNQEDSDYSIDEISTIFEQLTDVEYLKLKKIAENRATLLRNKEGEDLIGEVYLSLITGQRKWPRNIDLMPFFTMAVKSRGDLRNKGATKDNASELYENEIKKLDNESYCDTEDSNITSPESESNLDTLIKIVEDALEDDENAYYIFSEVMNGSSQWKFRKNLVSQKHSTLLNLD